MRTGRGVQQPTPNSCTCAFPGAEYSAEEIEFLRAMASYQQTQRRPFPTFTEVLNVARSLGWRKVAEPGPLPIPQRRD